jgi:large repetitive protein
MPIFNRLLVVCLLAAAAPLFAQSADQEVVSAVDAPDPVVPGGTLTYTVTLRNNGPDPATNGGINVSFPLAVTYQNTVAPAGFTCGAFGANVSCTTPSFAAGSTVVFTMTVQVSPSLISFPDGSFSTTFSPSGVTADPNSANNSKTATTNYDSPQIDLSLAVADAPDPVAPDGNITYTVDVGNAGPDAATSVNMSAFNNGSLRFQSAVVPAGWSCTLPSVGSTPTFTCTIATFAASASSQFQIVVKADKTILGSNDGTVSTAFSINGTGNETNNANNSETENTGYVAPDADMAITASDSPDPVAPDGNITYTVTVTNNGPDAATGAAMTVVLNNTLLYQSITVPAGWSCPSLAVGHGASFSCTAATFAASATSVFTVVLKAAQSQIGINDTTLNQVFTVSAAESDPNNANNAVTVQTQYNAPNVDMAITASDSPDPVAPDGNITYTVNVTNNGPDAAANATMSVVLNNTLLYQSITVPAGWSCPSLAVGHGASFTCTAATFAASATSTFTVVLKAAQSQFGSANQTINETFTTGSSNADSNNANNAVTVSTQYTAPQADLVTANADAPDPVVSGMDITYTQSITNNGPDAASAVVFSETLPSSVGFQSIAAPAGFSCTTPAVGASGAISCSAPSLANGGSGTFTLVVKVLALSGSVSVTTTASSAVNDPNGANNSATAVTTINGPTSADLAVIKTTAATSAVIGTNLTYTIVLTNNGPDVATSVAMTDALPASLLFQSITAPAGFSCTTPAVGATGTITCNAASLANGAGATFTLVVRVAGNASGTIANTAGATSAVSDPNAGNSSVTSASLPVTSSADLSITKSTQSTQAATNATINYTITVSNAGPSPATGVVVTDALPSGLQLVTATPSQGSCSGTTTITCNLGTLASGGSAAIALAAHVTATSGSIANTASVSSATNDPGAGNNSGSAPPIPVVAVEDIPTLSEWVLMMLGAALGLLGMTRMRGGA